MSDMADVGELVRRVMPEIGSAVAVYGSEVLTRVDGTAEAATRLGQRWLVRIFQGATDPVPIEVAIMDLAAAPGDADALAALRLQIRKVLAGDGELVAELAAMLSARVTTRPGKSRA